MLQGNLFGDVKVGSGCGGKHVADCGLLAGECAQGGDDTQHVQFGSIGFCQFFGSGQGFVVNGFVIQRDKDMLELERGAVSSGLISRTGVPLAAATSWAMFPKTRSCMPLFPWEHRMIRSGWISSEEWSTILRATSATGEV